MTKPTARHAPDWLKTYNAKNWAVENYISNVETLLTALDQRELLDDQQERLAGVLQRAEQSLLARSTTLPAKGRRRVRAA